jgi:hypothetical protein
MALDEAEKYEVRLIDGWRERFAIMKEGVAAGCDDPTQARHGSRLYEWIATEAAGRSELWVRIDFKSAYMTRGSFHMLADQLRVGWHPDYEARLAPPLTAPTPTAKPARKRRGAKS